MFYTWTTTGLSRHPALFSNTACRFLIVYYLHSYYPEHDALFFPGLRHFPPEFDANEVAITALVEFHEPGKI